MIIELDDGCRTIYGAAVQVNQLADVPYEVEANSTLNESIVVATDLSLSVGDVPRLRYFCIGNGGHTMIDGGGGNTYPKPLKHSIEDPAPFNILPMAARPVGNDLTAAQRDRYALRKIEIINNESYYVYYLRRLDLSAKRVVKNHKKVVNGVTNTVQYVPSINNLKPTPRDINNTGTNVATGDYLTANLEIDLVLDSFDIEEILNACTLKYGNDNLAIISEIGFVTGVDKIISTVTSYGTPIDFKEVAAAQVHTFMESFHALKYTRRSLIATYDLGSTEPLFL